MTAPFAHPVTHPALCGRMSATFPATPDAVPRARALARILDSKAQDDVALVTCELVTNSVRHAATSTVTVELIATRKGVHVEVTDEDPRYLPHQKDADPTDTGGRGLQIVACICRDLQCRTGPTGKTVSADIEYAPAAESDAHA